VFLLDDDGRGIFSPFFVLFSSLEELGSWPSLKLAVGIDHRVDLECPSDAPPFLFAVERPLLRTSAAAERPAPLPELRFIVPDSPLIVPMEDIFSITQTMRACEVVFVFCLFGCPPPPPPPPRR